MKKPSEVFIEPRRAVGIRDEKIYGHFLEHFHRQIYGGDVYKRQALVYRIIERITVLSKEQIQIRFVGGYEMTQSLF